MAKGFSKTFYSTAAWLTARGIALRRDHFTCQDCGLRAEEVHHLEELTPENIHDPAISLNPENLVSLCRACHNRRHFKEGDLPDEFMFDEEGQVIRR